MPKCCTESASGREIRQAEGHPAVGFAGEGTVEKMGFFARRRASCPAEHTIFGGRDQ